MSRSSFLAPALPPPSARSQSSKPELEAKLPYHRRRDSFAAPTQLGASDAGRQVAFCTCPRIGRRPGPRRLHRRRGGAAAARQPGASNARRQVGLCARPAPASVQARGGALHDGHVGAAVGHAGQELLRLQRVGRICGRGRLAHVRRQVERRAAVSADVKMLVSAAGSLPTCARCNSAQGATARCSPCDGDRAGVDQAAEAGARRGLSQGGKACLLCRHSDMGGGSWRSRSAPALCVGGNGGPSAHTGMGAASLLCRRRQR